MSNGVRVPNLPRPLAIPQGTTTGLSVEIYRPDYDATNGGVSSPIKAQGKVFLLFDPSITDGNWSVDDADEGRFVPLVLVRRMIGGEEYVHARPADLPESQHTMFGGNFIWSSDGRFRRHVSERPLPLHDRIEDR